MPEIPETIKASGIFKSADGKSIEIREVWASNLEEEMELIQEILEKYPYVAMDTEFPGVVARPNGDFNSNEVVYQTLRCNVDLLKIIQLGLTFTDGEGNWAQDCTCWQFNFKFSLSDDIYAEDSIELLKTSGIDFEKFDRDGIDVHYFGELMTMSGLVLNEKVKWVSFHSSYDFGYLMKVLTCAELPMDEQTFLELLHIFFPYIYDVKYMMTAVEGLYGGLSALADTLQVERIGPMHQAGSDSLLTAQTFFALTKKFLGGSCDDTKYRGELFGLGTNHTKYKSKNGGYTGGNSSNATGISLQARTNSTEQLYSASATSTVHYPPNGNGATPTHHGVVAMAAAYQSSFEDSHQAHEMSGIFGSP